MKKIIFTVAIFITCILLTVCLVKKDNPNSVFFGTNKDVCFTTIAKICSDPEKYDGKTVIFEGYLFAGSEIEGIFPEKKNVLSQTGICINLMQVINIKGDSIPESVAYKSTGKKVLVMGQYNIEETGHMNSCCGELVNIDCLVLY